METISHIFVIACIIAFFKYLVNSQVKKNIELIRSDVPTNQDYYLFVQGEELFKKDEYAKAICKFNEAIKIKPHQAYYNYRGCAHINIEEYSKAINDFNNAIELDPDENCYYYNRAFAHLHKKCYHESYSDFITALNLGSEEAKIQLAEIFGVQTAWLPNTKRTNHLENDSVKTILKHEQSLVYSNKSTFKLNLN